MIGGSVETTIANLIHRFETGALTRRQIIKALSLLVAANSASAAEAQQAGTIHGTTIDHVSILVGDLQRSAEFYQSLFGLSQVSEDKPNRILRLGNKRTLVSLRRETETGVVDHFAIGVENFNKDAVTHEVKRPGPTPEENIHH